jgi:hypothetical protein
MRQISSQDMARPSAYSVKVRRASKIVCLAAATDELSATAISSCDRPFSSRMVRAERWRSGSAIARARLDLRSDGGQILGDLIAGTPLPEHGNRLVVRDPEQPRPQRSVAPASSKRPVGRGERGLKRVLRIGIVTDDRAAIAVEHCVITLVQDGEGALAPGAHQTPQRLVAETGKAHPRTPRVEPAYSDRLRIHAPSIAITRHGCRSQGQPDKDTRARATSS